MHYFYQNIPLSELFSILKTSQEGLNNKEVKRRIEKYGKNAIEEKKVSRSYLFLRQFHNLLIYTLILASIVSLLIGKWHDSVFIIFIVFLNGGLGFWQEIKAETSIESLRKLTENQNRVLRNGELVEVSSTELVPGDIVKLHEGELATADMRLISSKGIMADESSITGESVPVVKDSGAKVPKEALPYELVNVVLAGTTIVQGVGEAVVLHTGMNTYFASIAKESTKESPKTPLMRSMQHFVRKYIIFIVSLFTVLGIIGYIQGRTLGELAYILLASLVSAVPEGLPIVTTLTMVVGAYKLSREHTYVRYLPSVETLGSTNIIASDKTGTITDASLTVKEIYAPNKDDLKECVARLLSSMETLVDPIDIALFEWLEEEHVTVLPSSNSWLYPFDTTNMMMGANYKINGEDVLFVKGAFETLRDISSAGDCLQEFEAKLQKLVEEGLRVLAVGKGYSADRNPENWKISLVGLIGFLDPPKKGVKAAVTAAKRAGIRMIMITGDHPLTAKAIAKEVGIWNEGDRIITGEEMQELDDARLIEVLKKTSIMARTLPEDKLRIVELLQQKGLVTTVTGDGINDVPALKAADLGIAMGNGTEAAKSVAKMIIGNSNLQVIVNAIKNARVIADNIRKLIYYLISTSFQEIIFISLIILFSMPLPLSAIQILWINIITGGLQDKTFVMTKAENDVMNRGPRKPNKQFFDNAQIFYIMLFGVVIGLYLFFLYRFLIDQYSFSTVSTIIFSSIVFAQIANGIQAQKEKEPYFKNIKRSFWINPYIYIGAFAALILHCSAIYLIPEWFHSTPLEPREWLFPTLSFFVSFFLIEIRKLFL